MPTAKAIAQRVWFASSAPAITRAVGELFYRRTASGAGSAELDLAQLERVLVVRLDKIGDVVLSTPFFRELRRSMPRASITLIVSPAAYPLVAACPYVNEVQTYDWRPSRYFGPLHHLHALVKARRDLWRRRFELAVVPCWGVDYYLASFLAYFSGAPRRLGYSERVIDSKRRLNRGFDRLFTQLSSDSTVRHEVEHNLDLLRFMGGTVASDELELWISDADQEFADQTLRAHAVRPDDLLVAIAPGAGAPKRCWPLQRYCDLAAWLYDTYGARVVILGGQGERALGHTLATTVGGIVIDLVGRATLTQVAAVLRRCRLFVGNDSGPMHVAAASGTTVVEISCHPRTGWPQHENSPKRFGPWGRQHVVLQPEHAQPPCTGSCSAIEPHCIAGVSLDQVKQAVSARPGFDVEVAVGQTTSSRRRARSETRDNAERDAGRRHRETDAGVRQRRGTAAARLKILLVHNRYREAGGEDYVFSAEADLLESHGHEVLQYTVSNAGLDKLNPVSLATRTVWNRTTYHEVRDLLRAHRPQLMHLHNSFPLISPSVCYAARAERVPIVQTLHNYRLLCPNGQFFRAGRVCEDCLGRRLATPGIAHACYRNSRVATGLVTTMVAMHQSAGTWTRVVDLFIAPTEFARQKFIAGGIAADRIVMKPHFIEHDPGVGDHRGGFALFVGRLSSEKGLEVVLKAWESLGNRIPLKVVGDGPLARLMGDAVAGHRGIEWVGWQPRPAVLELMRAAKLLVFPSLCYETFGLVIAEAYGTGLPVIASDIGSMSSLVAHRRTGLHFHPGDAADLAAQVEWALDHPAEWALMGGWAREEYETHFTAERNYRMLVDIYQSLANGGLTASGIGAESEACGQAIAVQ